MKPGFWELFIILAIVLILFGGRKIPEIMRGLGEGIRNFKDGISGDASKPAEKSGTEKPAGEKK